MGETDTICVDDEQRAPDELLVSMTDLDGRITYASESLARLGGVDPEDLVGQQDHVLRHPDVPAKVWSDLWTTVRAGQPWLGVIQNSDGQGGFYWVRLSVTPLFEEGQPKSYLAVHSQASAQEIAAAQSVFKRLRRGRSAAGRYEQGRWVPTGLLRGGWARLAGSMQAQYNLALGGLAALALSCMAVLAPWDARLAGASLLVCGAAAVLAGFYHRTVVRPMRVLVAGAQHAAGGNLSSRLGVKSMAEPGQAARAIEQLNMSLMGVMSEVRFEAFGIRSTTEQVAQGGLHLSDRTEQQAANLEQTSAAMQQFSQSTSDNAYATAQASGIAMTMSSQARAGGQAVQRVVDTIRELEVSSRRIGDIIGVIDGIAFRTNILALNAAVEAGRAGSEGRGFAVVAGEVRSLAQRSATAAREIKVLIEESVRRVDAAVGIVHNAGTAMDQTVDSVGKVSRLIEEISAATGGQATEIAQVTAAVRQLDEMTQQNAALVEQSAAAAETLKQQAGRLVGLTDVFKLSASA